MTIKEIAKLADVSVSTVSKVINDKADNINPQTRSRVLKIVKEYNFTPYGTVKSVSRAKKFMLGVLLRNASKASRMIDGILHRAQDRGYSILLLDSRESLELEAKNIAVLCGHNVDGVIWEPVNPAEVQSLQQFDSHSIPACLINALSKSSPSYSINFESMGYAMTQSLIDYGHKDIACLLKAESHRSAAVLKGFRNCLYYNNIPFSEARVFYSAGDECTQSIINLRTSGIVSSHLAQSVELYEKMTRAHYPVPSAFSLVSLKEPEETPRRCEISGIQIPYHEFGKYVAEQLVRLCEKTEDGEPIVFTTPRQLDSEDSLSHPAPHHSRRFVVVGALNLDITFQVEALPQHGKTVNIQSSSSTVGGKGTNQSIGLARLGHVAALIGETGTDADSAVLFDALEKNKVITSGIHRNQKMQTGKAYIYAEKNGESAISVLPGANSSLSPQDILQREHLFQNACYCLISTEISSETAVQAAVTAKKHGCSTIVKPAALRSLPKELLENTDIFVPNRREAASLCPPESSFQEQAAFFLSQGAKVVIITLDQEGCYLRSAQADTFFPAAPGFLPADTTAGADAFIAALASSLAEDCSMEKAVRIANYAAGYCISRQGAANAMIDRHTLEAYGEGREDIL
ncbi:LacI family DNA-binding transcriptional regulator [bacterium D16-50]|nr:LacI family DNA-binding transcriptional regulator [bacterium D16-50]